LLRFITMYNLILLLITIIKGYGKNSFRNYFDQYFSAEKYRLV
jgi:hypothetical protein